MANGRSPEFPKDLRSPYHFPCCYPALAGARSTHADVGSTHLQTDRDSRVVHASHSMYQ
jgi:hypothetical protein